MPSDKEWKFATMVDEVQRRRLELAGRDDYAEGYWHGIAVGMLAMLRLEENPTEQSSRRKGLS